MRASVRLLGRLRPPKPPPEEPVWPRPEPLRSQPFLQLPKTRTQAISFSSSSPLHPNPSPANIGPGITPGGAVVRSEGGEDSETASKALTEESRIPTRAAVLAKRRVDSTFLDYVHISVRGGRGGDGAIAFAKVATRRDHRGPPTGGSGGQGGSVYVQVDERVQSLSDVPRVVNGNRGLHGSGDCQGGRKGDAIVLRVPPGTMIRQISREPFRPLTPEEEVLPPDAREPLVVSRLLVCHPNARSDPDNVPPMTPAQKYNTTLHGTPMPPPPPIDIDLYDCGEELVLLCRGGKGGEGNTVFGRYNEEGKHLWARRGETPDLIKLELELRLIADVGLLGAPNAGKSTLLQALTGSKPRIAGYAFTTLNPQVGRCRIFGDGTISTPSAPFGLEQAEAALAFSKPIRPTLKYDAHTSLPVRSEVRPSRPRTAVQDLALSFTICDNPGLIANSHINKGLGHQFLLSVSRAPILALVLDFSLPLRELLDQADMLVREVDLFEPETKLKDRIRLVIGNKADAVTDAAEGREKKEALKAWAQTTLRRKKVAAAVENEDGNEEASSVETNADEVPVEVKIISGKWGQGIRDLAFGLGELVVSYRKAENDAREERLRQKRREEEDIIREVQTKVFQIAPPIPNGPEFGLLPDESSVE